ncbi:MAG: hypothetical protein A2297_08310 [Elusimicrobia bacterium RIFOXYB2_FULL_48_7]|nr:MAG: hypothetical protein A2297_08310 [Elusimicrobia bacterium RIFOXYB2_FULL_48_7]
MIIVMHVVAAVLIVTLGYFVLWTASLASAHKGVAIFGKVMAAVLFVLAGFILIGGIVMGPKFCGMKMHSMMTGRMDCSENNEMRGPCGGLMWEESRMDAKKSTDKEPIKKEMNKK